MEICFGVAMLLSAAQEGLASRSDAAREFAPVAESGPTLRCPAFASASGQIPGSI